MKTQFLRIKLVKEYIESNGMKCAREFIFALDEKVKTLIDESINRTKLNEKKVLLRKFL